MFPTMPSMKNYDVITLVTVIDRKGSLSRQPSGLLVMIAYQIELNIHEGFLDLVGLEVLVLHARLVLPKTLHGDPLLPVGQAFSRDRRVREEDEHDDTPDRAERAAIIMLA